MTNDEYENFRRATDPLKPIATSGHFAGFDGFVSGAAALAAFGLSAAAGLPELIGYCLGGVAAYVIGQSLGNEKWRRYHQACDDQIEQLRRTNGT